MTEPRHGIQSTHTEACNETFRGLDRMRDNHPEWRKPWWVPHYVDGWLYVLQHLLVNIHADLSALLTLTAASAPTPEEVKAERVRHAKEYRTAQEKALEEMKRLMGPDKEDWKDG